MRVTDPLWSKSEEGTICFEFSENSTQSLLLIATFACHVRRSFSRLDGKSIMVNAMNSTVTPQENGKNEFEDELKPGNELLHGQYVIEQFLNNGGFGITYLAKDSLHRVVVIKECFPEAICRRAGEAVKVRSRTQVETFRTIVEMFIEEARALARLSHPNIVGVHQVFEDNETAYMAMDFVQGRDLLEIIEGGETLTPVEIEAIAGKLLDAVGFIHKEGVLHRDIAPDNILLDAENNPVLIDFGAAQVTVTPTESYLGSMRTVKDGYSPQEFYSKDAAHDLSSDLYSLAASLYHVLTGELPANAQRRMAAVANGDPDPYVPVKERVSGYSDGFLEAIDRALSIFPRDRLHSAAEWQALLPPKGARSRPVLVAENGSVLEQFEEKSRSAISSVRKWSERTNLSRMLIPSASHSKPAETPEELSAAIKSKPKTGLYIGVAAAALLLALGGVMMMGGEDASTTETAAATPAPTPTPETTTDTASAADTSGAGGSTASAPAPTVPEQLPFFLEGQSQGDVQVSSASGTLGSRSTANEANELTIRTAPAPTPPQSVGTAPEGVIDLFTGQPATQTATAPVVEPTLPITAEDGAPVQSRATVSFPVVADSAEPSIVASASGLLADVLSPGQRVLSVNGFPIDALSDFQRVVSATTNVAAGEAVTVAFGVADPGSGEVFVREVQLPVVQQTLLLNGVQFETAPDGTGWATIVRAGNGTSQSDLQSGDRIVALMPNNELIDGPEALPRLLERDLEAGAQDFNFAVERDGEMWLVNMRYAGN